MHIRNGIRTVLRNRLRAILFALLILVLTLVLTLGVELWAYCTRMMEQIDGSYTSIILAEYMGEEYPDADAADQGARDALTALDDEAIAAVEGVTLWERLDRTALLADGYKRIKNTSPYGGYGVVVATQFSPMSTNGWGLSSAEDTVLPESRIQVEVEEGTAAIYAPGLDPLALPVYYTTSDIGRFTHYVDSAQGRLSVDVVSEELPELFLEKSFYWSDATTNGYFVVGDLPEGYDFTAPVYCHIGDAYEFYGEHVGGYYYTGRITLPLYTSDGRVTSAKFVLNQTNLVPEDGKSYLLRGEYSTGSTRTFTVREWLELTGEDDPALTDSVFVDYADKYRLSGAYAQVEASADVAALEIFQQGTLYLEEGRFPEAGETGVCVISGSTAESMGVGLGDTVSVSLLTSDPEKWYDMAETGDVRTWEIVGVTKSTNDYSGWFWVSDAEGGFSAPLFGYQLGRAVLDNRSAVQALEELQALMPDQVRLTLYDQGYSAAAQPIQAMRTAATAVTAAAICGAVAVLFLFAYLFVGRQRETVQVLVSLGAPRSKIRLWLLSGAALITAVSAMLGAALGQVSLGAVVRLALLVAELFYGDLRYSNAALGLMRETPAAESVPVWYAVAAGTVIFAVSLLLCLVFLRHARRENAPQKGKTSVRVPKGKTSLFGRGAVRFAMLSARRGGWRSIVVPAVALVLTVLLGLLTANAASWQRQLDSVYAAGTIEGRMVSTNGRNAVRLSVPMEDVRSMWQTGRLEEFAVSLSFGTSEVVALNSLSAAPEFCYTGVPEVEWLDGWDESCLAENEYQSILYSTFLPISMAAEGMVELTTYPALVSRAYLEEHGLTLGDSTVTFADVEYFHGNKLNLIVPIRIVGTFQRTGETQNIYVPLSFWCDPSWITGETGPLAEGERISLTSAITTKKQMEKYIFSTTRFGTCRFTLTSAYDLEPFRRFLAEENYSQVGNVTANRVTVLLLDQSFQKAAGGLRRYVTFGYILFPVLFLAVALMGFIISRLMVNARRMEFAILRGLGAPTRRVFATFLGEQGALCLTGSLIGALALTIFYQGIALWLVTAGFLACYLIGCALAIRSVDRTKLIVLLSERE